MDPSGAGTSGDDYFGSFAISSELDADFADGLPQLPSFDSIESQALDEAACDDENNLSPVMCIGRVQDTTPGELVWAKPHGRPFFPAILVKPPDVSIHWVQSVGKGDAKFLLRVMFLDDGHFDWIPLNNILPYHGYDQFRFYVERQLAACNSSKAAEKVTSRFEMPTSNRDKKLFQSAVNRADALAKVDDFDRRLATLSSMSASRSGVKRDSNGFSAPDSNEDGAHAAKVSKTTAAENGGNQGSDSEPDVKPPLELNSFPPPDADDFGSLDDSDLLGGPPWPENGGKKLLVPVPDPVNGLVRDCPLDTFKPDGSRCGKKGNYDGARRGMGSTILNHEFEDEFCEKFLAAVAETDAYPDANYDVNARIMAMVELWRNFKRRYVELARSIMKSDQFDSLGGKELAYAVHDEIVCRKYKHMEHMAFFTCEACGLEDESLVETNRQPGMETVAELRESVDKLFSPRSKKSKLRRRYAQKGGAADVLENCSWLLNQVAPAYADEFCERLLSAVAEREVVWKSSHPDYNDPSFQMLQWREIATLPYFTPPFYGDPNVQLFRATGKYSSANNDVDARVCALSEIWELMAKRYIEMKDAILSEGLFSGLPGEAIAMAVYKKIAKRKYTKGMAFYAYEAFGIPNPTGQPANLGHGPKPSMECSTSSPVPDSGDEQSNVLNANYGGHRRGMSSTILSHEHEDEFCEKFLAAVAERKGLWKSSHPDYSRKLKYLFWQIAKLDYFTPPFYGDPRAKLFQVNGKYADANYDETTRVFAMVELWRNFKRRYVEISRTLLLSNQFNSLSGKELAYAIYDEIVTRKYKHMEHMAFFACEACGITDDNIPPPKKKRPAECVDELPEAVAQLFTPKKAKTARKSSLKTGENVVNWPFDQINTAYADEFGDTFLAAVAEREVLWKSSHPDYNDASLQKQQWREIANLPHFTPPFYGDPNVRLFRAAGKYTSANVDVEELSQKLIENDGLFPNLSGEALAVAVFKEIVKQKCPRRMAFFAFEAFGISNPTCDDDPLLFTDQSDPNLGVNGPGVSSAVECGLSTPNHSDGEPSEFSVPNLRLEEVLSEAQKEARKSDRRQQQNKHVYPEYENDFYAAFLAAVAQRKPLWKRSDPDFTNAKLRNELFYEIAQMDYFTPPFYGDWNVKLFRSGSRFEAANRDLVVRVTMLKNCWGSMKQRYDNAILCMHQEKKFAGMSPKELPLLFFGEMVKRKYKHIEHMGFYALEGYRIFVWKDSFQTNKPRNTKPVNYEPRPSCSKAQHTFKPGDAYCEKTVAQQMNRECRNHLMRNVCDNWRVNPLQAAGKIDPLMEEAQLTCEKGGAYGTSKGTDVCILQQHLKHQQHLFSAFNHLVVTLTGMLPKNSSAPGNGVTCATCNKLPDMITDALAVCQERMWNMNRKWLKRVARGVEDVCDDFVATGVAPAQLVDQHEASTSNVDAENVNE